MPTTQELIEKISQDRQSQSKTLEEKKSRSGEILLILEFLANSFDHLLKELKGNTYKERIVNLPKVQEVKDPKINDLIKTIKDGMDILDKSVKGIDVVFPDVQKITGEVTVKNQITIPETKIPEYPKQQKAEIVSLPKYVHEELSAIKSEIGKLKLDPKIEVTPVTPEVSIDLESINRRLDGLLEASSKPVEPPIVNIDLSSLETAIAKVKSAVEDIKFPLPNFQSSWSHSLDMRAKDLPMSYTYTTVAGQKVIDYIEVVDLDGSTWRKTYTYDTDDTTDVVSKSEWVQQ